MPERSEGYQIPSYPPTRIDRDVWNETMGDLHERLVAREALEASFEVLIAQGVQASLDYVQVTVAPQLANLQTSINLAQEQIDQIIIGGKAPDTLKFGGQLPAYYATAQALTDGLAGKVPTTRKVNGKELSSDIELKQADVGLDKVNNTADADKPVSTPQQAALDKKVSVDVAQNLTPAQRGQAIANIGVGIVAGHRNRIINGDGYYWQRGLSQTTGGYGSIDRFSPGRVGTGMEVGRFTHTPGQTDVPGNPIYGIGATVTSVAGAGNYAVIEHHIEGVDTFAGQRTTFTFWARSLDGPSQMAVELIQSFGSGGSATVFVAPQKINLTTVFQKFSLVFDVPSLSGKVIGANDFLGIVMWLDAGANFNARSANLGQRSGRYHLSRLSYVQGDATAEEDPFSPRSRGQELMLCQRYCTYLTGSFLGAQGSSTSGVRRFSLTLPVWMRSNPGIVMVGGQSGGEAMVWEDVTPISARGYINMNNTSSEVSIAAIRFESEL